MIQLQSLEEKDCEFIISWNEGKDQDYLYQWAGHRIYTFPLTKEQITGRIGEASTRIFKIIDNYKMIGSVELTSIDKSTGYGKICRFILSDNHCGRGIGQVALREVINYAKREFELNRFELNVFTFNKSAIRCYENIGFVITKLNENNENPKWDSYTMEFRQ